MDIQHKLVFHSCISDHQFTVDTITFGSIISLKLTAKKISESAVG